MKTQMEAAIKMLQGGNINSMLPAALTIKMKGGNSLTKIEGGTAAVETLYQQDKTQGYMLNRSAKTFTPLTAGNPADRKADSLRAKVTKTSETMKILDYTCTKYIVELSTERGALKQVLWTTTEIAGLDKKNFLKQRMGDRGQSFYYEGISGIPLRMEMPNPQMNMIMQVTGIKRESLPAADFTIPADYKELKGFSGTQPRQ